MRSILSDLRRVLTGRWFLVAVIAGLGALWLSIGESSYDLLGSLYYGDDPGWQHILRQALTGPFGMLTLPALAALPFGAEALQRLRSGAFRPAVFRTVRGHYITGQALACALGGMLTQLFSFLLLLVLLSILGLSLNTAGIGPEHLAHALPLLWGRMLCGGLWAALGSASALVTETPGAAYLGPLCLCYALSMITTRFFPEAAFLNPMNWPAMAGSMLALGAAGAVLLSAFILNREVLRRA